MSQNSTKNWTGDDVLTPPRPYNEVDINQISHILIKLSVVNDKGIRNIIDKYPVYMKPEGEKLPSGVEIVGNQDGNENLFFFDILDDYWYIDEFSIRKIIREDDRVGAMFVLNRTKPESINYNLNKLYSLIQTHCYFTMIHKNPMNVDEENQFISISFSSKMFGKRVKSKGLYLQEESLCIEE